MPTPTIPDGELFMNATLYTGNGGTQTITNGAPGQSFQPDLIWVKSRSTADGNCLANSVTGAGKLLFSNSSSAESGNSGDLIQSFNSNGFTVNNTYLGGSNGTTNGNGYSFVGWQWKAGSSVVTNTAGSITSQVNANTTSGFSILTYTGTGATGGTIGHGLGVAPSFVIVKNRTAGFSWVCYHSALGSNQYFYLDRTDAADTISNVWGSGPTSTTFGVWANAAAGNNQPNPYIAYCWAPVAGYSAFGSYTGNGSADGPFIYTGFRPRFYLYKRTDIAAGWVILDSQRNTSNIVTNILSPSSSNAESSFNMVDFCSNGIKIRNNFNADNGSGGTIIYAAFAENPFKYANAR
jgi:hypothetical protein